MGGQKSLYCPDAAVCSSSFLQQDYYLSKGTKLPGCKEILATLLLSWERVCGLKFQASSGKRSHQAHRRNYWENQDSSHREVQKDLINAHQYLRRGSREDRIRLSSAVPSNWTRSNGYKLKLRKLHSYAMKHFFLCEGCPTLAQVVQNIIESPSLELWSWATFVVDPALKRIGLDDLKGSFPTSTVLWSYDFRAPGSQPCVSWTALKMPLPMYQDAHPYRQTFNPINLKRALQAQLSHLFLWQEVITTDFFLFHKNCCLDR